MYVSFLNSAPVKCRPLQDTDMPEHGQMRCRVEDWQTQLFVSLIVNVALFQKRQAILRSVVQQQHSFGPMCMLREDHMLGLEDVNVCFFLVAD